MIQGLPGYCPSRSLESATLRWRFWFDPAMFSAEECR
jgi:hypothetical protein